MTSRVHGPLFSTIMPDSAVVRHGRVVVDLHAGAADFHAGASWQHDTIAVVLSVTKGIAAICALMLAERGAIDLDAPIARCWPEFGANGSATFPAQSRTSPLTVDGLFRDLGSTPGGANARRAKPQPRPSPETERVAAGSR